MERRSKTDPGQDVDLAEYNFPVGVVVGFHALAGEVKVKPSTNNPELLADLRSVRVQYAAGLAPADSPSILKLRSVRIDRKMLLIKFKGLDDRTAVEHLEGARLFTRREELLPLEEEEFWVQDLVGMEVFTTRGEHVGIVSSIIGGATDLLEIRPALAADDNKTILIPFVKSLVPTVDMEKRRIEVDPIEGLLEPQ
jgi:16S rRNA processing protein RimM